MQQHSPWNRFFTYLPKNAEILDFGSYSFAFARYCTHYNHRFILDACDVMTPETLSPLIRRFTQLSPANTTLPFATNSYDGIVLNHVIEHLPDPIAVVGELLRILKPGGYLYIEAPSERSIQTHSHQDYKKHGFFSFWDHPTHLRPWTIAALYRIALGYGCTVVDANYIGNGWHRLIYPLQYLYYEARGDHQRLTQAAWKAKKFSLYSIIQKPETQSQLPPFRYLSLKED